MNLDNFFRCKKKVEETRRQQDRMAGKVDQMRARLKERFGVETLEDGEEKLAYMGCEREGLEEKATAKLEEYENKFSKANQ